uniref:solute carrier organic anion transporter family member 2B1-like n=1 Tax=Pristiophorus japonicus TaxID=55135 RepID=UPI00398EBCE7
MNLLAPVKPTTKSYEELCTLVQEHINPKESVLVARSLASMATYKAPKKMDLFRNIKFFVFCHGMLHLSMLLISIFLKTSISTIEKRFGFSSKMSGILTAVHEVGSMVLVVFVSYFGSKVHRPRVVTLGGLLVAMSGFLTTMPHFIMGPYIYDQTFINSTDSNLCQIEESKTPSSPTDLECMQDSSTGNNVVAIFIFTQLLRGIGMVPIQPFGISYIDDFGSEKNIPIYMGILYTIAFVGPALAFVFSSAVLQFYVDIDKSLTSELTPSDPRWVGAWWLGFLLIASLVALSSIPYFFFPRTMPKEGLEELKGQESKQTLLLKFGTMGPGLQNTSLGKFIKRFPVTLLGMLRNPIFLFTVIAKCSLSIVISGQATFLAKYMERQFSITAPFANILIGCFIVPISTIGILLGSVMVKKFKISDKNSACFCCVVVFISIIMSVPTLFLGCSTQRIAGINDNPTNRNTTSGLVSSCNMNCQCPATAFNPVCGADGVEYVSPCFAGCWLPGPILFGVIIDSTCIRWEYKCGHMASCQYYDNDLFRISLSSLTSLNQKANLKGDCEETKGLSSNLTDDIMRSPTNEADERYNEDKELQEEQGAEYTSLVDESKEEEENEDKEEEGDNANSATAAHNAAQDAMDALINARFS